jgi:hypothetical protein
MSKLGASKTTVISDDQSRLLIIESGAPRLAPGSCERSKQTVAIVQLGDESAADFPARAFRQIAAAQHSRTQFSAAVLLVGPEHDDPACAARRLVGTAIADYAGSTGALSELVAMVSAQTPPEVRERLLELADDLVFGAGSKPLSVRIHFIETQPIIRVSKVPLASATPRRAGARRERVTSR